MPRYYVPLTRMGELAFRLKMHLKLVDRLPESFVATLRDYRTAWYSRTLR